VCKILNINGSNGHLLIIVESIDHWFCYGSNALWWDLAPRWGAYEIPLREKRQEHEIYVTLGDVPGGPR
jgi:hypothetical protein